ncbi:MAG TPA: nitronate monooxygenase [Acidimicrobiales bacterium]|nr:nitronate monooxygenase [Acidimicrobiales bacterium]
MRLRKGKVDLTPIDDGKMHQDPLRTRICELFGVEFPIVQTGMGWVAGPRLASATANAGGLGIIAAATMSLLELDQAIHEVRSRTDKPFGVNIRTDQSDTDQRVELIASSGVKVASFAQAPSAKIVGKLKDAGVVTVATVGAKRHAEKVEGYGVDAVIAQGGEGGGHTGAIPTGLLVPSVVDAVSIPVIAAGGYFDGRGLISALAYGAEGIAMGTRFLLTSDSRVPQAVKQVYLKAGLTDTLVTDAIDGAPQRVINTPVITRMQSSGRAAAYLRAIRSAIAFSKLTDESFIALLREAKAMRVNQQSTWSQVIMAASAPMLTRSAMVEGNLEAGILPTGQVTGALDELPSAQEVIEKVMSSARSILERLC